MLLCYDCHWAIHNSFEFKWGVEFLDVWIPPTFEQIKRDLEMWGLDYILSQIPQEKIAEYKQYRQARMVD